MSDFFGKIKSGAGKVAFETDKMARTNKAKGELEHLKRQENDIYLKIGQLYASQRAMQTFTGPAFDELCATIDSLEQQCRPRTTRFSESVPRCMPPLSRLRRLQPFTPPAPAAAPAPAATPTNKFCPNCGKEVAPTVKFCPDCGSKL